MRWLRALFGDGFQAQVERGERLFSEQDWGGAKLAFERAVSAAGPETAAEAVARARERIQACRTKLLEGHLSTAAAHVEAGAFDLARESFRYALEVAPDEAARQEVLARVDRIEEDEAGADEDTVREMDDADLYTVISGTWTEGQIDEFDRLGAPARRAVVLKHDGRIAEACDLLASLAREHSETGCYVFLALGEARLALGDPAKAAEAIEAFLDRLPEDEEPDLWVRALTLLGGAKLAAGDAPGAEEALREAAGVSPGNYLGFFHLGVFLRQQGQADEALLCFEKAARLMGEMQPDPRVLREIGLACLDLGKVDDAKRQLEGVVQFSVMRGQMDQIDPAAATALARIHEDQGDPTAASDLFRHLAEGFDRARHFEYNREAGRLLFKAGDPTLARTYLRRALGMAPDEAAKSAVEAMLRD